MNRANIIRQLKEYFSVEELVCPHVYNKYGESSWDFLDTKFLHVLLVIRRDILNAPMFCNGNGGAQRGLRCNMCNLVKQKTGLYISAHVLGKAGDFTVVGMTAQAARDKIKSHAHLLPYGVRLERGVSWLHVDVRDQTGASSKIFEF